ncbi:FAD-binding and (Fe-S)-binding domain-containing protein [Methylobacterium sp. NEAU 140]|uniref:FAD-binding and (Fe-S)-binding domain-containing protein n=1 Tax=Methylobacterium sp. NEAU 140 TaxID=3064945 RepID=UPI0027326AA7|nr:FAD-binding and (Fe-S)-binding domain-containing protein [Methylobacterium sp. NEAU 140]MDP4023575.1 FAD-binding and (Fe-S)-binding domain-containing protein [Methylobacterium sp. NEAU 140]
MIPRLPLEPAAPPVYASFCAELRARGFAGDLSLGAADRTVLSTDNSIYQMTPGAVAFPRGLDDLVRIATLLAEARFAEVRVAPRGGGTGTNGQSLTDGLAVDLSRHMNRIVAIDPVRRTARVEAGVVKDQLNAALKPHGLFFAPELSTSNRATIGGMISTDACGQGSCLYGKTRDHVLELTTVLSDGTVWHSRPLDDAALAAIQARPDRAGAIHREVDRLQRANAALIAERFPPLNRCLTGYDLAHIRRADGLFDLNAVLCGSEGTLGFLAEATLNLLPIPRHAALVNVRYDGFDAALRDARALAALGPASIETVDSRVLDLARGDGVWHEVSAYFPDDAEGPAAGVNLVEVLAETPADLEVRLAAVTGLLDRKGRSGGRRGYTVAREAAADPMTPGGEAARAFGAGAQGSQRLAEDGDEAEGDGVRLAPPEAVDAVTRIWGMRKKAVGLLGNMQGDARPVAFVEDTAVPPENLADYIAEFRAALDRRGLVYGMFGHVDAGVLHVRPALDMKAPGAEATVRAVTEEVVALTQKYGGLLWGEHGKGVRSEFSPRFFGPLYPVLQAIKAAFDPRHQFNPGKIAAPDGAALLTVDGVPTKGAADRAIPADVRAGYDEALHCNGNGACFNWDPDDAMCPSWKGTRERRHSPKGRAQLMRAWLRRLATEGRDPLEEARRLRARPGWRGFPRRLAATVRGRRDDFSHAVHEAMAGCLACKSCVGQCPIKVDVPTFRAKFLELYHGRYLRPPRHHAVAALEALAPRLARVPRLVNGATGLGVARAIGLVHAPRLSGLDLDREVARRGVARATPDALARLTDPERLTSVVVVQDAFTSHYDTPVLLALLDLLIALGVRPWLAPYRPNGKPLHVHGFLGRFERLAAANAADLGRLAATGVALVGLDPSMTLTYRAEYRQALPGHDVPRVQLVQEWLADRLDRAPRAAGREAFWLLPHCTERTTAPAATAAWTAVFAAFGLDLAVLPSGCCGMAGTYGHEAEHRATSERIYGLSWAGHVADKGRTGRLLADGYSCRSQAKIVDGVRLPHPVEILRDRLADRSADRSASDGIDPLTEPRRPREARH